MDTWSRVVLFPCGGLRSSVRRKGSSPDSESPAGTSPHLPETSAPPAYVRFPARAAHRQLTPIVGHRSEEQDGRRHRQRDLCPGVHSCVNRFARMRRFSSLCLRQRLGTRTHHLTRPAITATILRERGP